MATHDGFPGPVLLGFAVYCLVDIVRVGKVRYLRRGLWAIVCSWIPPVAARVREGPRSRIRASGCDPDPR
jgi:hypothetical protein